MPVGVGSRSRCASARNLQLASGCPSEWERRSPLPGPFYNPDPLTRFFSTSLQALQKWGVGDRDFQATPNTRNEMMLKEAGEFASHLKRCEKDIRALKNATESELRVC